MSKPRRFSLFNFKFEPKSKYEPIEKTAKTILKRNKSVETTSRNENKLKFLSPGGAYCVYKGGGGSGGCVITGPYETRILPKDEVSSISYEITCTTQMDSLSLFNEDLTRYVHDEFKNTEIVWAKQILIPWFPGIVINPNKISKETKDLMKNIGVPLPTQEDLDSKDIVYEAFPNANRIYFIFLFNKKKTWIWLPESKLLPFTKENCDLFSKTSNLLSSKYFKELEKAFKKASKIIESNPII